MKLGIEGLKHEFKNELNTQDWFKNVGKQPADADQIFAPFCVKFADFKRLSKLQNQTNGAISTLIFSLKFAVLAIKFCGNIRLWTSLLAPYERFYRLKKNF